MCLAIPAQICQFDTTEARLALVEVLGVRRTIDVTLLADDPPRVGDWVLIHVGLALSKISAERAAEQLQLLAALDEAETARAELAHCAHTTQEAPSRPPDSP